MHNPTTHNQPHHPRCRAQVREETSPTINPRCRAQVREDRTPTTNPPCRAQGARSGAAHHPTAPRAGARGVSHTRQPPAPCIGFRHTILDEIHIDIAKQRARAYMDRLCRPDPRQWDRRAALMTATRHLWRYG